MGNSNCCRIQTERPVYQGGDVVNGTIHLSVSTPFQSQGVYIRVKGLEKVYWEETHTREVGTEDNKRTEHYTVPVSADHVFFRVEQMVYSFGMGTVMPGQFSFPFQFQLPHGLPGSFHEHSLPHSGRASRLYKVKGLVHCQGMFKSNIKHTQHLILNQALNQEILGRVANETRNIKQWCCINRGTADMRVHMQKDCYVAGETSNVVCEISNKSSVELRAIKMKLKRQITMNAHGKHYNHTEVVCATQLPGFEPFSECMGDEARILSLPLIGTRREMHPSSFGALFSNQYHLQIALDVPWGSDFHMQLPTTIYPPQIQNWQPLAAEQPPNWNPQVMPPVSFAVPTPNMPVMPPSNAGQQQQQQQGGPLPSAPLLGDAKQQPDYYHPSAPNPTTSGSHVTPLLSE